MIFLGTRPDPGVVKYNYWGLGESEMLGHHAETIATASAVFLGIFASVLTGGLAMSALPGLVTASGALTAGGTLLVGTAGGAGGGFVYGGIDTSSFTWSWSGAMKGGAAGAIGGLAGAGAGILARGAAQTFGLTCQAGRGLAGAALIGSAEGGIGGFAGGFAQGAFDTGTLAGAWHAGWTNGLMGLGMGAGLGALFHRVCFVAGTQVVTGVEEEGAAETPGELAAGDRGSGVATATRVRYVTVPIEQLVARGGGEMGDGGGQHVLARDQHDPAGPLVRRRIGRTYERTAHHLRVVGIRDDDGREQTVRVTDEHPFFVASRGWTKAADLSEGDRLAGAAGEASTVTSNLGEAHPEGVTVYNLEVEDDHTYFVRAEGSDAEPVWVHNAGYNNHHAINKAIGGNRKQFQYRVDRDLDHMPLHRQFQANLDSAGIPIRTMGGKGTYNSRSTIEAYFAANKGKQREVFDIVIRTARDYNAANGTRFLKYVKHNITRGNYKAINW